MAGWVSKIRAIGAVFVSFALVGAASAEPLRIRAGWVATPGQLTPILFSQPGLAKHLGKSYVLEAVRYPGSSVALTALAAGELELANLTFTQVPAAVLNGGMTDLRVVIDEFRDGVDDYNSNLFSVRKDSNIQKIEDLKGKVIAVPAVGSGSDIFMRVMLRKHGLEAQRDYVVVENEYPMMKAMLLSKKADLIMAVKPFSEDPELKENSRTLFTQREAVGPIDMTFLAGREAWIKKNRPALVDFFEDVLTATRWYLDPANHEAAVEIAAKFNKMDPKRLSWAFTKGDFYRDPNLKPDVASIQRGVDMLHEFRFIRSPLDASKYVDLSLIEEAGARLK
ncbi:MULTISPECIES: ABC transporter substrate-binding protein [unclassified Beijerinckia]|uniref:ABC transporter substrate-binding protein n=1 Tax=unclassified Beijerinckia TaxID=2638183 RepID=UPI0008972598|nr:MULTISPECIES: ABC transporter substrate-binding protein [unclassified Beijerinckia]MDH7795184.1 sulfonate transport system substrate-binding protein [Beijerinckia sp. GAS462]SEB91004.1 NitT/TauT family transport system substrate-binding protein [Beijerinckia sp. 28-YEA-48]